MPRIPNRPPQEEEEEEDEEEPSRSTQRGRARSPVSDDDSNDDTDDGEEMDVDSGTESQDQVVKKLVRYALACEFQRLPIRRAGISEKVLGNCSRGSFKRTFEETQKQLRSKFGMQMVELPGREKVTVKDKRGRIENYFWGQRFILLPAAAKTKSSTKPTASYILTTTLPLPYRNSDIIAPSLIGSSDDEAVYIGICTMIVSYISMSPNGQVPDHRFNRFLSRMNMEQNTPLDKTTAVITRMLKQGYIWKVVDNSGDEETIDWRVGPRGKMEISNKAIQGFVKEIYGDDAPEELDKRLQKSLGIEARVEEEDATEASGSAEAPAERSNRQRLAGRKRRQAEDD
ncbi:MAGE family-domain-containing protein [Amylocarpus encephaloides]|uniref:MAGE family-domain-containing protein n=1 Tax=Amylocarpus encephaloides TaxID=45428 RepID=A0A9P7Y871_9HELO|nr:MAGE family-domain-containing protein [Amylocarpus encephaloides]